MTLSEKADRFIAENRNRVHPRYRPHFHAAAPIGWCNDPNGFFYDGEYYHLFYQYYPYEAKWNSMHWGHWRSRDLLHWEDLPVAMAPDMPFDCDGCFSGTAWPLGGDAAHILYTGVHDGVQEQCLAHYENGQMVKALNNPVIPSSALPDGYRRTDFRDPKLFPVDGGWRAVMAALHSDGAQLVSFFSENLTSWRYEGKLCDIPGEMVECPDLFELDGRKVILFSKVERKDETGNPHMQLYKLDDSLQMLDAGWNVYAAQTCADTEGRRVAVAWMSSWTEAWPTYDLGHKWAGLMTLPRVLCVHGDRLEQTPPPALETMRHSCLRNGDAAKHAELLLTVPQGGAFELRLMETGEEYVALTLKDRQLTLDRGRLPLCSEMHPRMQLALDQTDTEIRVLIDACTIEVFVGGRTLSTLAFPQGESYGVTLMAKDAEMKGWTL